jgi:hypothetical protein
MQKHAIHLPKIINTPFMCSNLFQIFLKKIWTIQKEKKIKIYDIHAKVHERKKGVPRCPPKKERKSIAHLLNIS